MSDLSQLPRVGGFRHIARARDIHSRPDLMVWIRTEAQLLDWHRASLLQEGKPAPWYVPAVVSPFIRCGQWVFLCTHCQGGVAFDPEWAVACCFGCGAIFDHFVCPPNWRAIEDELLTRSNVFTRSWDLTETLADLQTETRAREGVG